MANVPLFSKGVHEYISYAGYFVFIFKRRSVFLISVGNFSIFSKGVQYFSYVGYFFYILKRRSVFLISVGNFSIFSKGVQYFSYVGYFFYILKRRSVFIIPVSVGNFSLFPNKTTQYFSCQVVC